MKTFWYLSGFVVGMTSLSVAYGAPNPRAATELSTLATVDAVHEIQAQKEPLPSFDRDLERLSELEGRYRESVVVREPLKRISATKSIKGVRHVRIKRHALRSAKLRKAARRARAS